MDLKKDGLKDIFKTIFNLLDGMGFILDGNGKIIEVNNYAEKFLNDKKENLLGQKVNEVLFSEHKEIQKAYRNVAFQSQNPLDYQFEEKGRKYKINIVPIFINENNCLYILTVNDITENKKDEELLFRYKQMVSSVSTPIVFLDDNLKIRSYNDAFILLYKTFKKSIISTHIRTIFGKVNYYKLKNCIKSCFMGHHIFMNDWFEFADGIRRYMQIDFHPLLVDEDQVSGIIISQNDISERKIIEEKLEELNRIDNLTGIYNRKKLQERLVLEAERFKRYKIILSFIMFDIDHFKKINDDYGHDIGDKVLIELTKIVKNNIRDIDLLCRWGGEEFMILLPHNSLKSALMLSEKLRRTVENHKFEDVRKITCSFGVTDIREKDLEKTIFKRVDGALYDAKRSGRNKVKFR